MIIDYICTPLLETARAFISIRKSKKINSVKKTERFSSETQRVWKARAAALRETLFTI